MCPPDSYVALVVHESGSGKHENDLTIEVIVTSIHHSSLNQSLYPRSSLPRDNKICATECMESITTLMVEFIKKNARHIQAIRQQFNDDLTIVYPEYQELLQANSILGSF